MPTLKGPEAINLLSQAHGYFLFQHRRTTDGLTTEIAAVALPSLQETVIQPPIEGRYLLVTHVSGPDEAGRIAYVQENRTGGAARLNIIRLDGSDNRVILSFTGESHSVFGTYPTLAPKGGNIAIMMRMRDATADNLTGSVEKLTIWNVDTRQRSRITVDAEDTGVSWFPDGNKLVYVASTPRDSLSQQTLDELAGNGPACRASVDGLGLVPLVYMLDVQSGETRPLHVGTNPVVSSDGRSMLLQCGGFLLFDMASHSATPTQWPGDTQLHQVWLGNTQTPLAFLGERVVLYWGLPTTGTPIPSIPNSPFGSFDAGNQLVTIKIASIGTGAFQTAIPAIDPRWQVSFGQPSAELDTPRDHVALGKFF